MRNILVMVCLAATVAAVVSPPAAQGAGSGMDNHSCSVSCWNGTSCTAMGAPPCSCRCRGFLGIGGAICTCGGSQFADPMGD